MTTIQLVRAGGTCEHHVTFQDNNPDFYAVQIYPEQTYTLFHRVANDNNVYQNEDGRLLKSDSFGEWKICNVKDNAPCEDIFKQNTDKSHPVGGTIWEDTNTGQKIRIEIQDLRKCQNIHGYKIETTEEIPTIPNPNFRNCKDYGDTMSASFISYGETNKDCFYSNEPSVKIKEDPHSILFIYDPQLRISSTTMSLIKTIATTTANTTSESMDEEQEHQTILYAGISLVIILIFLIIILTIYICKNRSKNTTKTTTENEFYGKFSDLDEYYEDNKKNMITDKNEYYEGEN